MWHIAWQAVPLSKFLHRPNSPLCSSPASFPSTLQDSSSPVDPVMCPRVNLFPPSWQQLCCTDPTWSRSAEGNVLSWLPASFLSLSFGLTGLRISSLLPFPWPCHAGSHTLTSLSSDLLFQIRVVMGWTCWGLPPPPHPFEDRHVGSEAHRTQLHTAGSSPQTVCGKTTDP